MLRELRGHTHGLTAATFSLFNASRDGGRIIDVYAAATSWVENAVTWTNQPGTSGTATASTTTGIAGLQQWSVLTQVQAQYAGTNNGFILRDRTENDAARPLQDYQSREGTPMPQLVINVRAASGNGFSRPPDSHTRNR